MKNLFILCALTWGGILFAQKEEESDTTRFKLGGIEFIIVDNDTIPAEDYEDFDEEDLKDMTPEERREYHENCADLTYWSGFEVGINLPMNGSFEPSFNSAHLQFDPARSMSFSFNIMEQRIRIIKNYFGLVTGIGFTNSRYGFKDDHLRLMANADSTWGFTDTTLVSGFTKNQLRVNYFNIPLLFQVNTSTDEDRNFHIAFGAIGGVRIGSSVKYVYDVLGGENDHKEKGRFNINPFQVCATARIGFRDFGLFANYNVLTLFESGKSETAYPLTFGASFHF
jgi:hypothetical protein